MLSNSLFSKDLNEWNVTLVKCITCIHFNRVKFILFSTLVSFGCNDGVLEMKLTFLLLKLHSIFYHRALFIKISCSVQLKMFIVMLRVIDLFVDLQIKCLFWFSEQDRVIVFLGVLVERTFLFVFALYEFHWQILILLCFGGKAFS